MNKEPTSKLHKTLTIVGIVLCVILVPMLIVNCTLIIKSFVNKDEVPNIGGLMPLIVLTDSMYPDIKSGDIKNGRHHEIFTALGKPFVIEPSAARRLKIRRKHITVTTRSGIGIGGERLPLMKYMPFQHDIKTKDPLSQARAQYRICNAPYRASIPLRLICRLKSSLHPQQ